jgi:ribosome biogenesis GTPase A
VVIELLDARLPGSSSNPLLAEMTAAKPALKVLNKQDLADAERTAAWLAHFNARAHTQALGLDASHAAPARALINACRQLAPNRGGMVKPLRVLICGIPNVGKSTLVNSLLGQRRAATGDEPGITKVEQRITLADDFYLFDTPGMLWPRITVARSGHHLAAGGSVGRNAFDEQEVATELLHSVRGPYAAGLRARYKLGEVDALTDEELLAEIGRKRGALMSGGRTDLQKAAEIALTDFRSGAWGRITLETPQEFEAWWAEGQARDAERAVRKAARKAKPVPQRDLAKAQREAEDASDTAPDQDD